MLLATYARIATPPSPPMSVAMVPMVPSAIPEACTRVSRVRHRYRRLVLIV